MTIWADKHLIQLWISEACILNEVPDLIQKIKWRFNGRFRRRMADANYQTLMIRLSAALWGKASQQDKENTVKHETCHLIARAKYGKVVSHGEQWKQTMLRAGQEPIRCHSIKLPQKTIDVVCTGCKIIIGMGLRRAAKMKRGQKYLCITCNTPVEFVNVQSKAT